MRKLTVDNERLCELLLVHGSVKAVAACCNYSESAIYKRIKTPEMRELLEKNARGLMCTAANELSLAVSTAVETLITVCRDEAANAQTRALAANSIIQHAARFSELTRTQRRDDEDESFSFRVSPSSSLDLIKSLIEDDEE